MLACCWGPQDGLLRETKNQPTKDSSVLVWTKEQAQLPVYQVSEARLLPTVNSVLSDKAAESYFRHF